jgi:geranylgeranyl pyrophosphate synthase
MSEDKKLQSSQQSSPCAGKGLPDTADKRRQLLGVVSEYFSREKPVAPLSMDELRCHCDEIIKTAGVNESYRDYLAILVNNQAWRDVVAAVPYEKRLLLLPQCLRNKEKCRADFDELGLICDHCGQCPISDLKEQAEKLGYAVLVAEGSPIVMGLIEAGKIEAVVGVSCMAVLERTFPYMEAGAVPGVAIPLLYDGCVDTNLDVDQLVDYIYMNSFDQVGRIDLNEIKQEVESWFAAETLSQAFCLSGSKTEQIAVDWLSRNGKRWRPFLTACTYNAIADDEMVEKFQTALRNTCLAVECFHKASLVHDDIEDDDDTRYGKKTLHAEYGVPVALNIGDYLLGQGYQLLADLPIDPARKAAMLSVAAGGHRDLCIGQGKELVWMRDPKPLTTDEVIEIFRKKTSPAFTVALKLGAILADGGSDVCDVLDEYSDALGIAYQIRDDIEDHAQSVREHGPSLLTAIENESPGKSDAIAEAMMDDYKARSLKCLTRLENPTLKGLLRRVLCKIFDDIEKMRCCDDHKAKHD